MLTQRFFVTKNLETEGENEEFKFYTVVSSVEQCNSVSNADNGKRLVAFENIALRLLMTRGWTNLGEMQA